MTVPARSSRTNEIIMVIIKEIIKLRYLVDSEGQSKMIWNKSHDINLFHLCIILSILLLLFISARILMTFESFSGT